MLDRILIGSSAEPSDPNFKNVTLLLHGDGSNGAQNNTFLDSSTNNFTITRNGNTTQGSLSPYGSNWSNYFDGTGDYLTAPYSVANSEWWTQDFTIEMWVYNNTNAVSTVNALCLQLAHGIPSGDDTYWSFGTNASGQVNFQYFNGSVVRLTGTTAAELNTWNHIAMVYTNSTGNISLYLNGSRVATGTKSGTPQNSSGSTINVGVAQNTYYNGYISNLRILDGTALYSGTTYTVPTAPLTAITNTSLLTCGYNRFRDASTNNFTITRNGDVRVTNFAPFAPSSSYSPSANGGSAYFDGTGDYLSAPNNAAFAFGTGDYTIELWINTNADAGGLIDLRVGGNLTAYPSIYLNSGSVFFWPGTGSDGVNVGTYTKNAWVHLAVSRSGSSLKFFINGAQTYSATNSTNLSQGTVIIAARWDAATPFAGYISNLRVIKGTAVYTAAFTPPSSPVTAITNTSLLTNFTNAAIFDNSMKNDLETVGNAQISTSVKKFGTGSIYFDGSGDNLFSPSTPNMDFGSGNWTIEMWVYVSTRTTNYPLVFGNNRGSWTTDALALTVSNSDSSPNWTDRFVFGWNNGGFSSVSYGTSQLLVANVTNSTGTWYHFAVVRNGTSVKMYRNGTEVGSATVSSAATFNWGYNGTLMGGGNWDGAASNFNGYLDEVRSTKGVARYTSAFTAPTAPFPNK